jgi:hypothetical protein
MTSTPKPRQLKAKDQQTATKRPVKAAPVRTPAAASKRPEETEERPTAGPSGVRSSCRQDSSPALSVAASDTMVSSVEGAASSTPVRDGGRKKSSSRGPPLVYAKKSRAREESRTSETSAARPGEVVHGDGSSRSRAVTLEPMAQDSGDSSSSRASSRGRSRDSSASSSRAAGSKSGAEGNSSSEDDDSGSEEDDSNSESDPRKLEEAEREVSTRLVELIEARKQMKEATKQVELEIQMQMVKKKKKDQLK